MVITFINYSKNDSNGHEHSIDVKAHYGASQAQLQINLGFLDKSFHSL